MLNILLLVAAIEWTKYESDQQVFIFFLFFLLYILVAMIMNMQFNLTVILIISSCPWNNTPWIAKSQNSLDYSCGLKYKSIFLVKLSSMEMATFFKVDARLNGSLSWHSEIFFLGTFIQMCMVINIFTYTIIDNWN